MRERIKEIAPDADVVHLSDLGLQDQKDSQLRRRWQREAIIWITRDEDFWSDAPAKWAVVWVSCHNPKLAFLRDRVAPAIAKRLSTIESGARLMVTADFVSAF
jgi:predicted nuclease of predicted toxin-antitoxin system